MLRMVKSGSVARVKRPGDAHRRGAAIPGTCRSAYPAGSIPGSGGKRRCTLPRPGCLEHCSGRRRCSPVGADRHFAARLAHSTSARATPRLRVAQRLWDRPVAGSGEHSPRHPPDHVPRTNAQSSMAADGGQEIGPWRAPIALGATKHLRFWARADAAACALARLGEIDRRFEALGGSARDDGRRRAATALSGGSRQRLTSGDPREKISGGCGVRALSPAIRAGDHRQRQTSRGNGGRERVTATTARSRGAGGRQERAVRGL